MYFGHVFVVVFVVKAVDVVDVVLVVVVDPLNGNQGFYYVVECIL